MAPTTYQRKPGAIPRKHCSPVDLKAALEEVVKGNSLRCAAEQYNINRLTLNRYYQRLKEQIPRLTPKKVINTSLDFFIPNYKKRQIFNDELEKELALTIIATAKALPVVTTVQIRTIAYEFAFEHEVAIPEIWHKNHMAGFEWYRAFIERHPHLVKVLPLRSSLNYPTPQKVLQKKTSISHTRTVLGYPYYSEDDFSEHNIKLEPDYIDEDEDEDDDTVVFSIGIKEEEEQKEGQDDDDDEGSWILVVS